MDKKLNICVLSGSSQDKLIQTILKRGHKPTLLDPANLVLYISDRQAGYDELWRDGGDRIKSTEFDAIIPRIHGDRPHATKILDHMNKHLGIWSTQSGSSINICSDKILTAQRVSRAKIRTPKTITARSPKDIKFIISKIGDLPALVKGVTGSQGAGIILLKDALQTNMLLESYYREKRNFLIQQFIDNGGEDLRLIVINGEVISCMKRISPADDIRSNLSLRGRGEKYKPDEETKQMAIDAVAAIPGLGWAGVDIMLKKSIDKDGKEQIERFLIELNSAPGQAVIDVTGINHYNNLIDWVEKDHNKKQNESSASVFESYPGKGELMFLNEINRYKGDKDNLLLTLKRWGLLNYSQ